MSKGFALAYRFLAFHDSGYKKEADLDLQRAIDTFDKVTENPEALYYNGRALFYRGHSFRGSDNLKAQEGFEKAKKYFDEYFERYKNDFDKRKKALYEIGLVLRYKGIFNKEFHHEEEGNKQLNDAIKEFKKIGKNKEHEAFYYQALANRELGNNENKEEAIKLFDKSIEINPTYADAFYDKGLTLRELGSHEEAIKNFNEAIEINPKRQEAWYYKGLTLRVLGNHEEAIKAFDKAIEISDKSNFAGYAWYDKGITLRDLGNNGEDIKTFLENHEKAIKAFDNAIECDAEYADAFNCRGITLRELADNEKEYKVKVEKYDEAIENFDNAIDFEFGHVSAWYDKGFVFCNKGLALRDVGKYDEAIMNFDDAIENFDIVINSLDRDKQKILYCRVLNFKGYVLLQYNQYPKYKEAIDLYKKLFTNSSSQNWRDINQAWNNIGLAYSCIGDYKKAKNYFDKSKNDSYALCSKGFACEKDDDFWEAIKAYLGAIQVAKSQTNELEPPSFLREKYNYLTETYYYVGLAFYNRGLGPKMADRKQLENLPGFENKCELKSINDKKDLEKLYFRKALEYFENAIEIDPHYTNAWIHEARTLYELKRNREAIDCLNEAIKINTSNGLLHTVLSNIYLDLCNLDDAYTSVNKALEIGYQDSAVWKLKGLIHLERKEYDDAIYCFNKAILFNAKKDDSIDPLLPLWKAYAKYLKVEFSFTPKDNIKYMESIHSIIKDLEKAFLVEKECTRECSLYFIGCFYYKINDLFSAKEKLRQCVELCEASKKQNKTLSPELLKVHTSACELLDNIWTYQIRPTWWKWWLDSPVHSKNRKTMFYGLLTLIFLLLFVPIFGNLYLMLGPIFGGIPTSNNIYSELLAGASNVSINWTLYILTVLILTFIWLFPCIERIKGKDFEIKMNSPHELKFELYPDTPPKKEPSPRSMGSLLEGLK